MKITLKSTTQITQVNGVPARIWEGTTESGIHVQALITRIAAPRTADLSQFEKELQEHSAPSKSTRAFPARLIL